jgi:hypothetical protein
MLGENELKSDRIENGPFLILSVIFIVLLLAAICAVSVMLLNQLKEPRPTSQQDIALILIPTASLPAAMPANQFSIRLPVILSGSVSVSGQIWKVTKIKSLGYELDGQHYDLATFTRLDSQDTVKAYCMNRGWDIPEVGTEYLLNAEGIFVPLYEPDTHPIQRFLMIH